jgi:hypothetical protein
VTEPAPRQTVPRERSAPAPAPPPVFEVTPATAELGNLETQTLLRGSVIRAQLGGGPDIPPADTIDWLAALRIRLEDERSEDALDAIKKLTRGQVDSFLADPTLRSLAVKAFDDREMGRAVMFMWGAAVPSLQLLWAAGCGWDEVLPFLLVHPPGIEAVLPDDGMMEGFVDAVGDREIAIALILLPGPLARKIEWLRAEDTGVEEALIVIDATPVDERPSIYDRDDLRDWFVKICDDEEMRTVVLHLRGPLRKQIRWLRAEGTNLALLVEVLAASRDQYPGLIENPDMQGLMKENIPDDQLVYLLNVIGGPLSLQMELLRERGVDTAPASAEQPTSLSERDVQLLNRIEAHGPALESLEAAEATLEAAALAAASAGLPLTSVSLPEGPDAALAAELSAQGFTGRPEQQLKAFYDEITRFEALFQGIGLQTAFAMLSDNARLADQEGDRYKDVSQAYKLMSLLKWRLQSDVYAQVAIATSWTGNIAPPLGDCAGEYPILAHPYFYTRDDLPGIINKNDLDALTAHARKIADGVIENVGETREGLRDDTDKLWQLDGVIAETKRVLGIVDGSVFDKLIKRKLDSVHAAETFKSIALAALAIGFTLLTGGTGAIAVAGAAGAAAVSAYGAIESYRRYSFASAAHGSAIDPARALSQVDSNALWLALDVIGAFLDLGAFAKTVNALRTSAEALEVTGEAAQATRAALEHDAHEIVKTNDLRPGIHIVSEDVFVASVVQAAERHASTQAILKGEPDLAREVGSALWNSKARALAGDRGAVAGLVSLGEDTARSVLRRFGDEPELLGRIAALAGAEPKMAQGLSRLRGSLGDEAFENLMRDILTRRDPGRANALVAAVADNKLSATELEGLAAASRQADPAARAHAITDQLDRSFKEATGLPLPGSQGELDLLERTRGLKEVERPAAQLADEFAYVEHSRAVAINEGEYVAEVVLPNGHRWRQNRFGKWCRFSTKYCPTDADLSELLGEAPEAALQVSERPGWHPLAEELHGRTGSRVEWYERRLSHAADRAQAAEAGRQFAEDFVGWDRLEYVSTSITERTPAGRAQVSAITPADSPAGIEFEHKFRLTRTDLEFKPDGIEASRGRTFWFMDNKAQLGVSGDLSATASRDIEKLIEKYIDIQRELADRGCRGLIILVDTPERLRAMTEIVAKYEKSVRDIIWVRMRR